MAYLDDLHKFDHRHWEDRQKIIFTAIRADTTVRIETDYGFKMNADKARQFFGDVALDPEQLTWILPAYELNDSTVEVQDTIEEEDHTKWTVQAVTRGRHNRQWIVRTTRQVTDG